MNDKHITKQLKQDILNNNYDFDVLSKFLIELPEETISAILSSYLYLFRNIDNNDNKILFEDLNTLINNYIKKNKSRKILELIYHKIDIFINNLSKSFKLEELIKLDKYISVLLDIQNKCIVADKKRAKGEKYRFILYLIFEKRDIELLERYIEVNKKELLINNNILPSIFISILEKYITLDKDNTIDIRYYNRVINIFLRGKIYDKLFSTNKEDYLNILRSSNKDFVWDLIYKIENDMYQTKDEVGRDYNISFILPKYEEYKYKPNGKIDLTTDEIFTIDNKNDKCLDDAMSLEDNKDGTYTLYIHMSDPTSIIPYVSNTMREALRRNNTIYLVDDSLPIFDRYLSDNLLSILPGKNTNTLTIKVLVLPDYSLDLNTLEIIPSVIQSKHKLSYEETENIINHGGELQDKLLLLAKIFDKQAIDNPCVSAYHRMKDKANNKGTCTCPISHMMIEQCNVFANSAIYIIDKRDRLDLIMPWRVQRKSSIESINTYLEDNFDIEHSKFKNFMKDYMMKSKYSPKNIGHEGLGLDGYVKISGANRRAMDDLAIYILHDLYINRNDEELDTKYFYWEKEVKYWCDYANNKNSDNTSFGVEYNYLYNKGKILERRK